MMEKTLFSIAIILVTTKVGAILSRKINMPEVLGMLLAGVAIGPAMLKLVQNDGNIHLLSTLEVILLMFLAGIETDVEKFKKSGKSSFVIALFGILIPFVLCTGSMFLFSDNMMQNTFIGVVLTATSVSITVETLNELGKLNTRAGINILDAAVIDDVIGLILISIFLSTQRPNLNHNVVSSIIKSLLFCVFAVALIMVLPKLTKRLEKYLKPNYTLLTFSIIAVLGISCVAESFGISAIVGAYLCGVMLSRLKNKNYIEKNIKSISSCFLSPIFFASIGL